MKSSIYPHLRKTGLILSGQLGAHLLSIGSLASLFVYLGYSWSLVAEIAVANSLIRIVYCITRGPRSVLPGRFVRRRVWQVITDEIKIGVALSAACFVMLWPVTVVSLSAFLGINLVGQCAFAGVSRLIIKWLAASRKGLSDKCYSRQILIVGTGERARKTADRLLHTPEIETSIGGFLDYHRRGFWRYRDIPLIGHPSEIGGVIANCQIDAIFIALDPEDLPRTEKLFATAEKMGVPICFVPEIFQPSIYNVRPEMINGMPVVVYRAVPEDQLLLAVKYVLDKVGAICGLLLASPILAITALAIKIESKGPVFFRQLRSGLNGKPFKLYKFRTMCADAEAQKAKLASLNEMSGPVFKVKNDPRVTRVGRFLRKTSLDEFPQFINVLNGDMSLVGPRPPLPKEVAEYEPWQRRKLSVKPGVTCTWQVSGRNSIDFEDWMQLDLDYIDNWSLWEDTKILAKTIPAVLKGSGAS